MDNIAVLGAGQMGGGIAQVLIEKGFKTLLYDIGDPQLEMALSGMEKRLGQKVHQGQLSESDLVSILSRLRTTTDFARLADCDLAIEAAPEDEKLKKETFRRLDETLSEGAVIASNTSSISISYLAAATNRPDRVIGLHFMNPVPVMDLVEVIRGELTSDATFKTVRHFLDRLGKETILAADFPGFVVNRILYPMLNEAIFALYEGIATPEDIDKGMQLGTRQPMGPLALADFIGLDTLLAIGESLHRGFGDPKFRPCPLLTRKVASGQLGKKSGRGFYDYSRPAP